MPHPELINRSGFAFEAQMLSDEDGIAQFVPIVQATYAIGGDGALELVQPQPRIVLGGQWLGDPAKTSMAAEPQIAFMKPATDIVLLGHAYAASRGATQGQVGIRVGALQKAAAVIGDRWVTRRLGISSISSPQPFERIPIVWERAFGGWDRHDPDPARHRGEPRNLVGVGFRTTPHGDEDQPLPNFEDPRRPFRGWGDTPPPMGFGFVAPDWQPRAAYAGTYDEAWLKTRKPLLPRDFDRRFFNAASPGLIAPGYLRGDEPVVVVGASPEGRIGFRLPGGPPPVCRVGQRGRKWAVLPGRLDTVVVDMDTRTVALTWRAQLPVRNGIHDVLAVEVLSGSEAASLAA